MPTSLSLWLKDFPWGGGGGQAHLLGLSWAVHQPKEVILGIPPPFTLTEFREMRGVGNPGD